MAGGGFPVENKGEGEVVREGGGGERQQRNRQVNAQVSKLPFSKLPFSFSAKN